MSWKNDSKRVLKWQTPVLGIMIYIIALILLWVPASATAEPENVGRFGATLSLTGQGFAAI